MTPWAIFRFTLRFIFGKGMTSFLITIKTLCESSPKFTVNMKKIPTSCEVIILLQRLKTRSFYVYQPFGALVTYEKPWFTVKNRILKTSNKHFDR